MKTEFKLYASILCCLIAGFGAPSFGGKGAETYQVKCAETFLQLVRSSRVKLSTQHTMQILAGPDLVDRGGRPREENEASEFDGVVAVETQFVYSLEGDTSAKVDPLEALRERADRMNGITNMVKYLGPWTYNYKDGAHSPIGEVLSFELPLKGGEPVPFYIPVHASYERVDPNLAATTPTIASSKEMMPDNIIEDYYRDLISTGQQLRDSWGKGGYVFVISSHYAIEVGPESAKGHIKYIESFTTKIGDGSIDESQEKLLAHETPAAQLMAEEGANVLALKAVNQQGVRTADTEVTPLGKQESHRVELKATSDNADGKVDSKTVLNRVWHSLKGGGQSPHIMIDARNSSLTVMEAQRAAFRIAGKMKQQQYKNR